MILMNKINKNFGNLHVLKDINLEVKEGEKVVVIGPSGSGKSTLIRCMNYLEEPTSGSVVIDGYNLRDKRTLNKVRQSTAMVFQQFNLYPHMT
ncbi:MAG: ATP-binding cassette domain-containing protein, partial [Clostridium butyricum]|nr:ATP-binding cassette domain-containing protein [Clostridium butyricum]